jgi:hypothetical protein
VTWRTVARCKAVEFHRVNIRLASLVEAPQSNLSLEWRTLPDAINSPRNSGADLRNGAFRIVLLRPSVGRVATFTRSSSCHEHAQKA